MNKNILLFLLLLLSYPVFSQAPLTVSGVVWDNDLNETLPGVTIYLKDRPGIGTTSEVDGRFSIRVSKGDVIVFSYIGYQTQEFLVTKDEPNLRVNLNPISVVLEEAVVTGMGTTQRKISVVGAITSVNVNELQTPGVSITNMLGGRVPGIISVQTSGEPGDDISEFWVRGIGTFGASSSALVLIDGLEGNLSEIDPADVESFSILKDASATAVYGVRGANGVVLVTTKRGEEGKLQITGRANFTLSHITRMPEYLGAYDYALLANEARVVRGDLPKYSDMELTLIHRQLDPDLYPDINWQKEIMKRNTYKQSYYTSIRGGGKLSRYFISLGLSNEPAAYKQSPNSDYNKNIGYNKYTFRSNIDINLTESSKVYFGIEGFYSKNTMPGISNTDNLWQALALLTPLTIPKVYSTGHIPSFNSTAGYAGGFNNFSPFVALNHTGIYTKEQGNLQGTIAIEQDFSQLIKGLKMRAQGAYTATSYFDELRRTIPEMYYATGRNVDGSLRMLRTFQAVQTMYSSGQDQYRKFFLESNITYENVFDENHRLSGLLYYYISDHKQVSSIPTYAQTLPSSLAALPIRYQGLSGRITYGYRDTYLLDLNFGYTGSENFQPGRQYGFFPSMAIGWIPTQYDFVKNGVPWLNFFKVRFSHGSVGNDRITGNRRFAYLTTFDYTGAGWGGTTGINENLVGADNLEWEKAIKSDLGIESQLFKQRLSFTVDFFNDKRDGIFQQRTQVPGYIGAVNMPYGNVGSMVSYGSDGNITYLQPVTDNLSFTVRGNFTYSRNEVKNWEQVVQKYDYQYNNGWPNGTVRGFKSLGLFRDEADVAASATQFGTVLPGDIKYKDINADGKIDDYDKIPLSLQNNFPSLMYGFGGEISYKDWTFGFLFKGTGKMEYYHVGIHDSRLGGNNGIGYIPFHDQEMGNVLSIVADQSNRWTPASYSGNPATENPNAMFPRLTYGYNENNSKLSDFWKRDGRYLRLQEVSASYKMKLQKLKKIGISSIEFQLVGSNLYTWDKVGIYHPEQAWRNGIIYPIPAQYSFQLYIHL